MGLMDKFLRRDKDKAISEEEFIRMAESSTSSERRHFYRVMLPEGQQLRASFPRVHSQVPPGEVQGAVRDLSYSGLLFYPDHEQDFYRFEPLSTHLVQFDIDGQTCVVTVILANKSIRGLGCKFQDATTPVKKIIAKFLYRHAGERIIEDIRKMQGGGASAEPAQPRLVGDSMMGVTRAQVAAAGSTPYAGLSARPASSLRDTQRDPSAPAKAPESGRSRIQIKPPDAS